MNQLYFSDDKNKSVALSIKKTEQNFHNYIDAFFVLINGMDQETLSNLCDKIYENSYLFYGDKSVTREQCYELTQNLNLDDDLKKVVFNFAQSCISDGMFLGTKMSEGFNTSAWLSHSYHVSECCAELARMLGLDEEKARTYGLLHDMGRKKGHTFNHVIDGFEKLVSLGWYEEAVACLTHSFVKGGRCSNNEKAVEGFYVDEDGNSKWRDDAEKDDITLFLENYQYNDYDLILNIADLMATNKEIVSPYDRIKDIATRRELDITNRGYFLADITNVFIDFLKQINYIDEDTPYIKASKDVSLEEIEAYFKEISQQFYDVYNELVESKSKKKG